MSTRRGFFKTLFGAAASIVAAPLLPAVTKTAIVAAPLLPAGYIYCPYIPLIVMSRIIDVQPMNTASKYKIPLDIDL